MTIRRLLLVKSALEAFVGLMLLVCPGVVVSLLLGASLEGAVVGIVARVAGSALFAIGIACGLARNESESKAARGIIAALLIYDLAMIGILLSARFALGISGIGLWPAVILHAGLGAGSLYCLI